jgi:ferredoxin-NADP reductase
MIEREATIISIVHLTADTVKLDLQLLPDEEDNLSLDFEPGQFVQLAIPDSDIKRPYSLTNAPNWDGTLEFLIKLRPQGKFSTFLSDKAAPGMKLSLEGPLGWFTLHDNGLRPRYFVAGGCGVASIMSMIRRMAEWQEPHQAKLFFGVWREEEVFYQQELADLAAEYPNFQYQICVFEASESWQGYRGSVVTALLETLKATDSKPDIYICGSTGLVESVVKAVKAFGINEDELIYERFIASTQSAQGVEGQEVQCYL